MSATYKNNRPDVTICTMLFKMPDEGNLASIKGSNRKFDEFYLPSLKKLCETFHQVALWCDEYTANYLKENGLADRVNMHVLDITQLPHWADRDLYCDIMHSMKHYVGYFLHRRTPEAYKDYLPLMFAKPAVVDWAAKNNRLSRCADFYRAFERAHNVLVRHNLICVDQGIFQTMMKLDGEHMFELKHINGYRGLYATIANGDADFVL